MASQSQRWKALERDVAKALHGRRVHRRWDLFQPAADVLDIQGFEGFIVDCKAYRRFSHHTLLDQVQAKYCTGDQVPILATKHSGQHGANVTLPLSAFADLLQEIRRLRSETAQISTQRRDRASRSMEGASKMQNGPTMAQSAGRCKVNGYTKSW